MICARLTRARLWTHCWIEPKCRLKMAGWCLREVAESVVEMGGVGGLKPTLRHCKVNL